MNSSSEEISIKETNLLVTFYEHLLLFYFFIHLLEHFLCSRVSGLSQSLLLTGFFCTPQLRSTKKNTII